MEHLDERASEEKEKENTVSNRCSKTLISPIGFAVACFPVHPVGVRMRTAACILVDGFLSPRTAHARGIEGFSVPLDRVCILEAYVHRTCFNKLGDDVCQRGCTAP